MWDRRCRVTRVKDGDTLVTYEDCGKGDFEETDVRLFGTFAPEKDQQGWAETTKFAQDWVAKHAVGDWPFTVLYMRNKANTREQVTFGRYVCMLRANDTEEYLNTAVAAFVAEKGFPRGTGGGA